MPLLIDSFWRAVGYCLRPRVMLLCLLPLLVMLVLGLALAHWWWDGAVLALAGWLDGSWLFSVMSGWLARLGMPDAGRVLAPLLLVLVAAPLAVIVALLLVSFLATPAVLRLVVARRFPQLQRRGVDSLFASMLWATGSTLAALLVLVATIPLWLVPPLILVLPPLIWGWLTYRVMSYDALNLHASTAERRALVRRHRPQLLLMGVVCGYLSAAPALVWISFVWFALAFIVLIPLAVWIYTVVFVFSALWFGHYCLAALVEMREAVPADARAPAGARTTTVLPDEA